MAAVGRISLLGAVITLLLHWRLALCRQPQDITYDWDKNHRTVVKRGEAKGVCFWEGSTSCVKYELQATGQVLTFVARGGDAQDTFHGVRRVKYVKESVCIGRYCQANVEVSKSHSYCLVIVNRNNLDPRFTHAAGDDVHVDFRVSGCSTGFWTIIAVIIAFVLLIALFSSCIACCLHFFWKHNRRQRAIQMVPAAQMRPGGVPSPPPELQQDGSAPPLDNSDQYPELAVGVPQGRSIQFLEAKL